MERGSKGENLVRKDLTWVSQYGVAHLNETQSIHRQAKGTFDNFFLVRPTPPGGRSQVDSFKAHLGLF